MQCNAMHPVLVGTVLDAVHPVLVGVYAVHPLHPLHSLHPVLVSPGFVWIDEKNLHLPNSLNQWKTVEEMRPAFPLLFSTDLATNPELSKSFKTPGSV
jgi:hypothetical protein